MNYPFNTKTTNSTFNEYILYTIYPWESNPLLWHWDYLCYCPPAELEYSKCGTNAGFGRALNIPTTAFASHGSCVCGLESSECRSFPNCHYQRLGEECRIIMLSYWQIFVTAEKSHMEPCFFLIFARALSLSPCKRPSFAFPAHSLSLKGQGSEWVCLKRGLLQSTGGVISTGKRNAPAPPGCWPWWLWKTRTGEFIYLLDPIPLPPILEERMCVWELSGCPVWEAQDLSKKEASQVVNSVTPICTDWTCAPTEFLISTATSWKM